MQKHLVYFRPLETHTQCSDTSHQIFKMTPNSSIYPEQILRKFAIAYYKSVFHSVSPLFPLVKHFQC